MDTPERSRATGLAPASGQVAPGPPAPRIDNDAVSWMQVKLDNLGLVLHVEGKSVETPAASRPRCSARA